VASLARIQRSAGTGSAEMGPKCRGGGPEAGEHAGANVLTSCDGAGRWGRRRSNAVQSHREADATPEVSVRSRPWYSEGPAWSQGRSRFRLPALAVAGFVAMAGMQVGVKGDSQTLCQPAHALRSVASPPFTAGAHVPSAAICADTHVPLANAGSKHGPEPKRVQIERATPLGSENPVKQNTLNWPGAIGSPVSAGKTPGLRATEAAVLHDVTKSAEAKGLPSTKNLKVLSAPQLDTMLDTEAVSEAEQETVASTGAAKEACAAAKQATKPVALGLDIGWSSIPHPLKVARGGEDSHIIARLHGVTLLGVFDGVGGWAELGVDPAEYARKLGRLVENALAENPAILKTERPLLALLKKAFDVLEEEELAGSCTASLGLFTQDGKLHVLNIGDSGIHVLRNGHCVFQTGEQQHYFNCPYQLGMGSDDRPEDADYYVLEDIEEDDMIVAATDGVWDNLYEAEMLHIVKSSSLSPPAAAALRASTPVQSSPETIARAISEASHLHGKDDRFLSPFTVNAQRHGLTFSGGKLDDVTVVVSRVCDISPPTAKAKLSKSSQGRTGTSQVKTAAGAAAAAGVDCLSSPVSSADEAGSSQE